MSTNNCPRCGIPLVPGQRFCSECGFSIPATEPPTSPGVTPLSSPPPGFETNRGEARSTTPINYGSGYGGQQPPVGGGGYTTPGAGAPNYGPPQGTTYGPANQPQGTNYGAGSPSQGTPNYGAGSPPPNYAIGPTGGGAPPPGNYPPQGGVPPRPQANNTVKILLVILGVVVLACAACGIGGYFLVNRTVQEGLSGISTAAADPDLATTFAELAETPIAQETSTPINRQLDLATPRMFKYSGLEISVTSGVITNSLSYDPSVTRDDAARLELSIEANNPTNQYVSFGPALLQVKLSDGTVLEEPISLYVDARGKTSESYTFAVDSAATWTETELVLDELDHEPATLALDGPITAAQFPAQLEAGQVLNIESPKAEFALKSASVDLDANNTRVGKGKRFLIFNFEVTGKEETASYVAAESFVLHIGDETLAPEDIEPAAEVVGNNEHKDIFLYYEVPADTTNVILEVGDPAKPTVQLPLDLSTAKP